MRIFVFVLLTSVLFFALGPLLPLLADGAFNPVVLILSRLTFVFGGLTAFGGAVAAGFGAVFALCSLLGMRAMPHLVSRQSRVVLGLVGALLGLSICLVLVVAPSVWLALENPALAQMKLNTVGHWLRSDAPAYLLKTFVLPTVVCGALVWLWLVPRFATRARSDGAA